MTLEKYLKLFQHVWNFQIIISDGTKFNFKGTVIL
jgi:hypothetical protein